MVKALDKNPSMRDFFLFCCHFSGSAMLNQMLPFPLPIDPAAIAGTTLWALALYLGLSPLAHWVMEQFNRWLNFAERSLYTSDKEFERTRRARENQNAFLASLMSVVPFLILGGLSNFLVAISLGGSWAISTGMIACIGCGVYELGRRAGQASD
jgi:hypothetical protein